MKLAGMPFHLLRYTDAQNKAFRIVFMYMLEVLKEEISNPLKKKFMKTKQIEE